MSLTGLNRDIREDNIIRAVPMGSTSGFLEELIRTWLKQADLLGKPNSPELRDRVLEFVSDLLKRKFPSHKFEIEVGGRNRDGQFRVTVGLDKALMEKNKIEVKKKEREGQTTIDEDLINFLVGGK